MKILRALALHVLTATSGAVALSLPRHQQPSLAIYNTTLFNWDIYTYFSGQYSTFQLTPPVPAVTCKATDFTFPSPIFACDDPAFKWNMSLSDWWYITVYYTPSNGTTLQATAEPRCAGMLGCQQIGNVTLALAPTVSTV